MRMHENPLTGLLDPATVRPHMSDAKITITLSNLGPNDLNHKITLEADDPIFKVLGPPMVGKSSVLRAIRHGLTGTHDLTDAGFQKWLDGGSISVKPSGVELGSVLVGPRGFGPKRIDFTGPRKTVETALRHAPIEVFDPNESMDPTEARRVFKSAIDLAFGRRPSLDGEIETKREIRRHLVAAGVTTADVDREIAALMERKSDEEDQVARAKAVVKAAWGGCYEWVTCRGLQATGCGVLNPIMERESLSATGSLKVLFDTVWGEAEDRTLSTASQGARASFEITWFTRLADALNVPAVLLLDDAELSGWAGNTLDLNLRALRSWALSREQPAWIVIARQEDPVFSGASIYVGRKS